MTNITKLSRSITLANKIEELTRISIFLEETAEQWELPMALGMSLNLVLEEAFTNVVQYAYTDDNKHDIDLLMEKAEDELTITIIDDGQAYDPTKKTDPDINLAAEDRPIGGLGIFLIKKTMDDVAYERKNDKNHLIMKKRLS